MRILLIHQYFLEKGEGGGSRFNEMTQVWSKLGHKVTVLAGMVNYTTGKKPERYKGKHYFQDSNFYPNVDVLRCHVSESYNVNFLGRLWGYFSFMFSSIWGGLRKTNENYDVILVTSPPLFVGMTAYVLSQLKGVPFVFEVRDLWPESAIDTGVLKNKAVIKLAYWFEKFLYKRAKFINVLTPAFRDKLIEKGIPAEKIKFIPNAADFTLSDKLSDFDSEAFKKELGLEHKFVITYVGAHGVANHLIQLLDASEYLRDTNIVFQLIGSGMQKKMLQEETKKRGLEQQVFFRDPVAKEAVFKYIMASDMGASVLKKVDTFKTIYSNKTFDYMSCRIPILLAIDGVSRTLVEAAQCGVYVEPENAKDIADKLKAIYNQPEKLIEMGESGYHYAKEHFDRETLAKTYLSYLIEVVEK
ncbi:glycosyltransferase family 4 protein [Bizionia saleffrena]|uniref:Glycosyltransferase family 4 protein n=1 Tax=Bizionia saleffrena TaxID=291189 RepID=A0A8H2QIB2_9FLAO|nr:glycosyltransferase family 4 protein [Bizionia saleffrena]TYB69466.1 glycosyltransferase family 4 protein [Bizionia saleffrena]